MLIKNAMEKGAAEPKGAPQEAPQEQEAAMPGEEPATPEEQEAYERVVLAGTKAIYDPATGAPLEKMLADGADSPAETLARAATTLMDQLDEKSGGKIPESVLLPAMGEILSELSEVAPFPVEQNVLERAHQMAVMQMFESYGADPAEIEELLSTSDPEQVKSMVAQQQQIAAGGM